MTFLLLHADFLLNNLLMKIYTKINTYLLENFPILWHSKITFLLLTGVILNLLAFIIGFWNVSYEDIIEKNLSYQISVIPSLVLGFLSFVVIILWILLYYGNTAARKFYPLPKYYFSKLFLLISFGFLFNFFYPFSGSYGVRLGIKKYVSHAVLLNEIDEVNLANCLLAESDNEFSSLKDKLNIVSEPYAFFCLPENNSVDFELNENIEITEKNSIVYDPLFHPENCDTIDGNIFQMLTIRLTQSKNYIFGEVTNVIKPSKQFPTLRYFGMEYNLPNSIDRINFEDDSYYTTNYELRLKKPKQFNRLRDLQEINFQRITNKNYPAILSNLKKYKKFLQKYNIEHTFNENEILKDLIACNFIPKRANVYHLEKYYNQNYRSSSNLSNEQHFSGVQNLYSNAQLAQFGESRNRSEEYLALLLVTFCICSFLLVFEFCSVKNLAFFILIGGGFVLLNVLICVLILISVGNHFREEHYIIPYCFFVLSFILLYTFWAIKKQLHKKFTLYLYLFFYFGIHAWIYLFLLFIDMLFAKRFYEDGDNYYRTIHTPLLDLMENIPFNIIVILVISFWKFRFIKKVLANPE